MASLLGSLVVAPENTSVYDRSYFQHWIDADHDGCDTRAEVLQSESLVPTDGGCPVTTGNWYSYYDAATWTLASDVDIDHMVPLSEAWDSGAWAWTAEQRKDYANDLDYLGSLWAVTDNVNQSKSDSDPVEWLPPLATATCDYLTAWTVVKWRWNLTVDDAEAQLLAAMLTNDCANPSVELPAKADVPTPVAPGPFPDVPGDHQFVTEITWLATTGVTAGYSDGQFKPGAAVSRQAFAAYLYRYTHGGADAPACTSQWFPDVPTSNQFCGHITWLAGTGITTGYADGGFHPTAPISRQAMAAFLQRYRAAAAPVTNTCTQGAFTDVTAANTFCGAISWLAGTGITTGYPGGAFRPTAAVTRQAFAAFLYRYDNQFGPSNPPIVVSPPPPPPPPTQPANPGDSVNCTSFATWPQAQQWFNTYYPYYGDVARLDSDGDRIACESLPGAP